jgi:hypothetical protein
LPTTFSVPIAAECLVDALGIDCDRCRLLNLAKLIEPGFADVPLIRL